MDQINDFIAFSLQLSSYDRVFASMRRAKPPERNSMMRRRNR